MQLARTATLALVLAALMGLMALRSPGGIDTAHAADLQFTTVPGATGQTWAGTPMALGGDGGSLPAGVSAVFHWSNETQGFDFWFRGFPANFNTLASLQTHGYYFFQSATPTALTMPGSSGYQLPAPEPSFSTVSGATGKLWTGGAIANPADLPAGVSAVFRWNNDSQGFNFWFRGFPDAFNTLTGGISAPGYYFFQSPSGTLIQVPGGTTPPPPPPPPLDEFAYVLIDNALASNTLPIIPGTTAAESAIVYRIYADFSDPRIPAQLNGRQAPHMDGVEEASELYPTLSPAAQALVLPFISVPMAPGSWVELSAGQSASLQGGSPRAPIAWQFIESSRIRVWWHHSQDEARAQQIFNAMETKIWPDLVGLMGRTPLNDASVGVPNGGDGRYDIYLAKIPPPTNPKDFGKLAFVSAYPGKCKETPSYMVVNTSVPGGPTLNGTVTHEFMHSLQFAHGRGADCLDYRWMMEATATWAEDFVYPNLQTEQVYAEDFLNNNEKDIPLEKFAIWDYHPYGAYLFFFYLSNMKGDQIIPAIWNAAEYQNSLDAVAQAVGGGAAFKDVFHDFALRNWNRPPVTEYQQWDGMIDRAPWTDIDVHLGEATAATKVGHLSAKHYHFNFYDDAVKSVQITNPVAYFNDPSIKVQAMVRMYGGDWKAIEDWTDVVTAKYCREKPEEKIEELAIIISNAEFENRSHVFDAGNFIVKGKTIGCSGWVGTISSTWTQQTSWTNATETSEVTLRWEHDPALSQRYYKATSGSVTWHHSGTDALGTLNPCSGSRSGSYQIVWPNPGGNEGLGQLDIFEWGDKVRYTGVGTGGIGDKIPYTCPKGGGYEKPLGGAGAFWFSTDPFQEFFVSEDGNTIQGTWTQTYPQAGITQTWSWHFTKE